MDAIGFYDLTKQPFAFGTAESSLEDILGQRTLENIHRKFNEEPSRLATALRETVRFLYLAAHSPRTLFFPGDKLMDDLWHALVIETMDYQILCDRLRPGSFIHHSGVPFNEYAQKRTDQEIHEEQCSWLASYTANFGPIDAAAFPHLNLIQSLAQRLKGDLHSVNQLGAELLKLAHPSNKNSVFDFNEFVEEIAKQANEIDRHPALLKRAIRELVAQGGNLDFDTNHLEKLFGASTAFAFTFWQHLAASERLAGLEDWQTKNIALWEQIKSHKLLVGLATTHLANPAGAGIKAEPSADGFLLSGAASWVCGYGIFDKLLVGFDAGECIAFAIIDFPLNDNHTSITFQEMACLRGSATARIQFNKLRVANSQIVSQRLKTQQPPAPRPTAFVIPELGIAKRTLDRIAKLVDGSNHPKHRLAAKNLPVLFERLNKIEQLRSESAALDVLVPLRDELNRDSVRLLSLALGAQSILPENHIARIQSELLLLDAVIHSPASLETKIEQICKGRS